MNPSAGIEIIAADAHLLVLNKPAGLLSVPGRGEDKQDCLSRRVQSLYPDALIVHRLDMATSGLLLMARGPAMQSALAKLFENRTIHKRYLAVVDGNALANAKGPADVAGWQWIDLPIAADWPRRPLRVIDTAGKPSQTRWRCTGFDAGLNASLVELEPITGRSHQLRVHMQAIGHPILGDALYASEAIRAKSPRLMLHACRIGLAHPASGAVLDFSCPPPFAVDDFGTPAVSQT